MPPCAYCPEPNATTRDHVPPLSLFPSPRSSTLITVPCCERCRKEQSSDDELFRFTIVSAHGIESHPKAQQALAALFRSFEKPRSQGFRGLVHKSLDLLEVTTPAGVYVGHQPTLRIDRERVNRVGERIVRGLFFHELGKPLPQNYRIRFLLQQLANPPLQQALAKVPFPPARVTQEGVFSYTWVVRPEDPLSTIWVMSFYETLFCLGTTKLPPSVITEGENVG